MKRFSLHSSSTSRRAGLIPSAFLMAALIALLPATTGYAQVRLVTSVGGGGGGAASGSGLVLLATVGQSAAGATGNLRGGFLATASAVVATSIEDAPPGEGDLPDRFELHQNYPNPFNPSTTIRFDVRETVHVRLTVHDLLGRRVARLVDRRLAPGRYQAVLDAGTLASGVYFYRVEMGDFQDVKTMVLMK